MGLAIEGNNLGIYKAYIKDINSLKDLTAPPLFGKSNRLNLGPVTSFLPILTAVEELLIAYVYAVSNIAILATFTTLAKTY